MASFIRKKSLPPGFFDASLTDLCQVVPEPTVFELEGRKKQPLFVSTLLHGNEPSGLLGLQRLLRQFEGAELPRSLILFVGNVCAANKNVRRLDRQPDFNRIWKGHDSEEGQAAADLLAYLKTRDLFAGVDIHDNTGTNPPYGCVSKNDAADLYLASLFNRIAVTFTHPDTTLSVNLSSFCPAVTIECGKAGNPAGVDRACRFIEDLLHLDHFPEHSPRSQDLTVFHSVARIKVRPDLEIETGVHPKEGCLVLHPRLDHYNFSPLKEGTVLAYTTEPDALYLEYGAGVSSCFPTPDRDVSYLRFVNDCWNVSASFTPSMLTLSEKAIHEDCLGYIMTSLTL